MYDLTVDETKKGLRMSEIQYRYIEGLGKAYNEPHRYNGRNLPFIVMVYTVEGHYHVGINGEELMFSPGEAAVIPEHALHDVYMEKPGVLSWAHINAWQNGMNLTAYFDIPLAFLGSDAARLGELAEKLARLPGNSRREDWLTKVKEDALVAEMVSVILDASVPRAPCGAEAAHWLMPVLHYISAHLADPIRLQDLAGIANMSVTWFSACFRKQLFQSPMSYVMAEKIRCSSRLLAQGCSVAEAAARLRFCDEFHFSRMFAKYMGCSPSAYRKRLREQRI